MIANFIEDWNVGDPVDQLKVVMSDTYIASAKNSLYRQLDALTS